MKTVFRAISINDPGTTLRSLRGFPVENVERAKPDSLVMPYAAAFSRNDLSLVLAFYNEVQRAYKDGVPNLLVFSNHTHFSKRFSQFDEMCEFLPSDWDLLYLGWSGISHRDKPEKDKPFARINYASGLIGLAINNRFYHLFLEGAKVPQYPLDEHIKSLSLACDIYCAYPSLVST